MCLHVRRIDRHLRLFPVLGRQTRHDLREDTPVAAPLPAVVERFVGAILLQSIALAKTIAIGEDNTPKETPVINPGLAV